MTSDDWQEFELFIRLEKRVGVELLGDVIVERVASLMRAAFASDYPRLINIIQTPAMIDIFCYKVKIS
jgi:hypothetical protein